MFRLLTSAALAAFIAQGAAFAADSSSSHATTNDTTSTQSATQTARALPQEIKQNLKDDGFTDIRVVPGSFVVSAKDKHGNPVMMSIGPHSMSMLTAIQGSETTGSGSTESNSD